MTTLRVAEVVFATEAEGPGRRMAVWFQGCRLRCPGCCNPSMLPFEGGESVCIDDLLLRAGPVEGISLLGGEPTAQATPAGTLARAAQSRGVSAMVYSGFTLEHLRARRDTHIDTLLKHTDLLVDGPYLREQPDTTRRWIGSRNQRLHFLSDRYAPSDPRFRQCETVELRLVDGKLIVNGWPMQADQVLKTRQKASS